MDNQPDNLDMFGEDFIDATPEQVLEAMERPDVQKGLQTIASMLDVGDGALKRYGIDPEQTRLIAAVMVRSIAWYLGGKTTYMPHGRILETALRDNCIWDDFTGENIEELAKKYAPLTEHALYRILRQQKALHTNKIQPSLDVETEQELA